MPNIAENFYMMELSLDSRENDYLNKIVYPKYGDDYVLEIDGIEHPISIIKQDERLYFGNLSMMGMGPDTGENFYGVLYIDEDEEYIDDEYIDYYTLDFDLGILDQNDVHTIGLKFKGNSMPLFNSRDRVEYDWDSTNDNDEYIYYRSYYPYGKYTLNLFPEGLDFDNIDSKEAALPIYQQYYASNFYFDDQVYENIEYKYYKKVYKPSEWDEYIYFGNMHIKYSDAPDTGEPFLYIPFWDGEIRVITSDPDDHNIRCEFTNLPKISNIKKIEDKFLPDNLICSGYIVGDDKESIAIGKNTLADNESIALGGAAKNHSITIGSETSAIYDSIAIGPYKGDGPIISGVYTKNYWNSIIVECTNVDYYHFSILKNLTNLPIKFLKSSFIEGTEFNENQVYNMDVEASNINDSERSATLTLYGSIPNDNLLSTGYCELIFSSFAIDSSILIGDGLSSNSSVSINSRVFGKENISISTPEGASTIPEVLGNNNTMISSRAEDVTILGSDNTILNGSSSVSGNNNVILNSSAEATGSNNIQVSSNVPLGNNSIYLGTGNEEGIGETFTATYQYISNLGRSILHYNHVTNISPELLELGRIYKVTSVSYGGSKLCYYKGESSAEGYNELLFYTIDTGELYAPQYSNDYSNNTSIVLADHAYANNVIAIGQGSYTITDNQVVLGKYPDVQPDTGFAVGMGEDTQNRKNLFEVSKDGNMRINSIITGGLDIRNTNNEASYTSQDCMVLRDIDTGWEYAYQMKSGALVTTLLPTHIEVTKLPDKLEYEQGDTLDPSGMEVTAFYPDGQTQIVENIEILPVDDREFLYNIGINAVPIKAKLPLSYTTTVNNINVVKFDYESALIDFNYTVNPDGSITLDSWKQTLNGQPSTEMIIPNNGLIIF